MVYLSRYKSTLNSVIVEDSNHNFTTFFPSFYLGKWILFYNYAKFPRVDTTKIDTVIDDERFKKNIISLKVFLHNTKLISPEYVLFIDGNNLKQRVGNAKKIFPDLQFETTIDPSFLDKLMQKLNPVNKNYPVIIYRTNVRKG
jgi:hypothetical protein